MKLAVVFVIVEDNDIFPFIVLLAFVIHNSQKYPTVPEFTVLLNYILYYIGVLCLVLLVLHPIHQLTENLF